MRKKNVSVLITAALIALVSFGCSEDWIGDDIISDPDAGNWSPLISSGPLDIIKDSKSVVVVDVRSEEEYLAGHVPGSINLPILMPESGWIVSGKLLMELQPIENLEAMLSEAGITKKSKIVLVTGNSVPSEPPFVLANSTRVLATLHYVGVKEVAILDGGINNWIENGLPLETEPTLLPATTFEANPDENLFVTTDYVKASIGSKIIIDTRDANVYSGEVIEPWASKAGHIPTAKSMPVVDVWNEDDTYKSKEELKELFKAAVGEDVSKDEEIIIYCGVGGYTSTGYFVLHDILGYENVKYYDGSAQAWVIENDMEL